MALTSASARCSILFAAVVVRSLSKPLKDVNDVNVFLFAFGAVLGESGAR